MDRQLLTALLREADEKIAAHQCQLDWLRAEAQDLARTGRDAEVALEMLHRHELSHYLYIQHRQQIAEVLEPH